MNVRKSIVIMFGRNAETRFNYLISISFPGLPSNFRCSCIVYCSLNISSASVVTALDAHEQCELLISNTWISRMKVK